MMQDVNPIPATSNVCSPEIQRLIIGLLSKILGSAMCMADIKDLAQDVNIRIITHQYDPSRGPFEVWVKAITKNMAIDAMRARQRQMQVQICDPEEYIDGSRPINRTTNTSTVEDLVENLSAYYAYDVLGNIIGSEVHDDVNKIFNDLSDSDQKFLLDMMDPDYDHEAYARKIGSTYGAIRVRKHRLMDNLRKRISDLIS